MGSRGLSRFSTRFVTLVVALSVGLGGSAAAQVIDEPPPLGALCSIIGTSGDDTLVGTPGDDVICGLDGNDTIDGRGGNDYLVGGDGDDSLIGGDGTDRLSGGAGTDVLTGGAGADVMSGGAGGDAVSYILLEVAVDVDLALVSGNEAGLDYSDGNGAPGENDRISHDIERVVGSEAGDTIRGSGRPGETLEGRGGSDTIDGRGSNDVIAGGADVDHIDGGAGNDILVGGAGNDVVDGGDGVDTIVADAGADGADVYTGGAGTDQISYAGRAGSVRIDLASTSADQGSVNASGVSTEGDTVTGFERATGGSGADLLFGTVSAGESFVGNNGADDIRPGGGEDSVDAGAGDDLVLVRDGAADTVDCGPGIDSHRSDPGLDVLTSCETYLLPETDLGVVVTNEGDPLLVDDAMAFNVTVTNHGNETETAAQVTIKAANGLAVTDGTCGFPVFGEFTCTIPSLAAGQASLIRVSGVKRAGISGLVAQITGRTSTTDPNPENDSASDSVTGTYGPSEVEVELVDPPATVQIGAAATFVTRVTNHGPRILHGAAINLVHLRLSGAQVADAVDCQAFSEEDITTQCHIRDLAPGESQTLTLTGVVTAQSSPRTISAAFVDSFSVDSSPANDSDSASVTITPAALPNADLGIVVSDDKDPVIVDEPFTFIITVTNHGPVTEAGGVKVRFGIGDGWTITQGSCLPATSGIECTLPALPGGGTSTIRVTGTSAQVFPNGIFGLSARIDPARTTTQDPNPANDTDYEGLTVNPGDADLGWTYVSPQDFIPVGTTATFRFRATNAGPRTEHRMIGVVRIPTLSAVQVTGDAACPQGLPAGDRLTFNCEFTDLAPGQSRDVVITGVRATPGVGTIGGSISRYTTQDTNPFDDAFTRAVVFTEAIDAADLATSITVTPRPIPVGTRATFQVALSNLGPATEQNATVVVSLAGLTQITAPARCTAGSATTYTCSTGAVGSRPVVGTFTGIPSAVGSLTTTATITGRTTTSDPNSGNDSASITTPVVAVARPADVSILSVTHAPAGVTYTQAFEGSQRVRSASVNYRVVVRNADVNTTNARILLPATTAAGDRITYPSAPGCTATVCTTTLVSRQNKVVTIGAVVSKNVATNAAHAPFTAATTWRVEPGVTETDNNTSNNTAAHSVRITPTVADIELRAVTAVPASTTYEIVHAGGTDRHRATVRYRFLVRNLGPTTTSAHFRLPPNPNGRSMLYAPDQATGATCSGVYTTVCTIPSVPAGGGNVEFTIPGTYEIATLAGAAPTAFTFTVGFTVEALVHVLDDNLANNTKSVSVRAVPPPADLAITDIVPTAITPLPATQDANYTYLRARTRYKVVISNPSTSSTRGYLSLPQPYVAAGNTSISYDLGSVAIEGALPPLLCSAGSCSIYLVKDAYNVFYVTATATRRVSRGTSPEPFPVATAWSLKTGPDQVDPVQANNVATDTWTAPRSPGRAELGSLAVSVMNPNQRFTVTTDAEWSYRRAPVRYRVSFVNRGPHGTVAEVPLPSPLSGGAQTMVYDLDSAVSPAGARFTCGPQLQRCFVPIAAGASATMTINAMVTHKLGLDAPIEAFESNTDWQVLPAVGDLENNPTDNFRYHSWTIRPPAR